MPEKDYVSGSWRASLPKTLTAVASPVSRIETKVRPSDLPLVKSVAPLVDYAKFDSLALLRQNLANSLTIVDDEVMKGYLDRLDELPIVEADNEELKKLNRMQFFRITKLVYQEEEFSLHNMATLYRVLADKPCTLALMVKSDGVTVEFYLGVRSRGKGSTGTMRSMLENSLKGLFPGSQTAEYYEEDLDKQLSNMNFGAMSCVSCVADLRQEETNLSDKVFVQGLEKFVDSMKHRKYQAFFIAESLSYDELIDTRRGYENIYSQLSPFARMEMNFSLNGSQATAKGESKGKTQGTSKLNTTATNTGNQVSTSTNQSISDGTNIAFTKGIQSSTADGITETNGTADGSTDSVSDGHTEGSGTNVGGGVGGMLGMVGFGLQFARSSNKSDTHTVSHGTSHTISQSESISRTLNHGISSSTTDGTSRMLTKGTGTTDTFITGKTDSEALGKTESQTFTDSLTLTDTFGNSQGITLTTENKTLASVAARIEKELARLDECESLGMWNFAAYFVGDGANETETAAGIYRSVVSGKDSGLERSVINTWQGKQELALLAPYIKNFLHPTFSYAGFEYNYERYENVTGALMVSTPELAIHIGLPHSSVKGLPVVNHVAFAQETLKPADKVKSRNAPQISLGKVYHMGETTGAGVEIDVDSLTSHLFVTGSTGSGKSNAVCQLLAAISNQDKKFLVIEPAKGEYGRMFPDVRTLGTNPKLGEILKLNPFAFPDSVHVLEHIDRLVEIFNVCWPMYAAMPAILKDATVRAYKNCGWDLELSENTCGAKIFPTFADVEEEVGIVLSESEYSAENKGDYIGSLVTRLNSLTNGLNGLIFSSTGIPDAELFNENLIINLSRIGSMETKSLIMGLLVIKLAEFRMDERENGADLNRGLCHVTVLEEAHNLLKRTSTEQATEGANLLGKSVEMLANSIAEMRTYGEGFIIADQSPGLLDMSVIRNTNTKIILRLPDYSDRELTGRASGLNDAQIDEIIKLETGVAAVSQIDWLEPILCKFPRYEGHAFSRQIAAPKAKKTSEEFSKRLKNFLLTESIQDGKLRSALKHLVADMLIAPLRGELKAALLTYINNGSMDALGRFLYGFFHAPKALDKAKMAKNIDTFIEDLSVNLEPRLEGSAGKNKEYFLALILKEARLRDGKFSVFYRDYTKQFMKGGHE